MVFVRREMKKVWLWMLEPPWRHSGEVDDANEHWGAWVLGWAWAVAGLVLGALVAPSLVQFVELWDTPYQDVLIISVAVVAGFLIQLLGFSVLILYAILFKVIRTC